MDTTENKELRKEILKAIGLLKKIVLYPEGMELVSRYVLIYGIAYSVTKDHLMTVIYILRDKLLHEKLNEMVLSLDSNKQELCEMTITECVDVYIEFALFVKFTFEKIQKKGSLKGISVTMQHITDAINTILEEENPE